MAKKTSSKKKATKRKGPSIGKEDKGVVPDGQKVLEGKEDKVSSIEKKMGLTKKEIKEEILKCGRNPTYFITNYVKISHPTRGLIPFKLYDYQKDVVKDLLDHRFNIVLKARQLGMSTTIAAYAAWMLLFHRNKEIMVVATKFETAANLTRKVKVIIKNVPSWIRIASIAIDNRTSFELSNGSQIKASSTSEDAGRSEALSLLIIDEAAFINGLDDMWKAIRPTIQRGGRCIANSSPGGVGNWFHKQWVAAEEGKNGFNPIKLMWNVHPEQDQVWFEKETKSMTRKAIAQELECSFLSSGETVFDPEDLTEMEKKTKEPLYKTGFDRNLWIWEEFDQEYSYLMSCDCARGDGQDYSVFHIFKLETMEIIAEYQGKVTPDLFANLINQTGREYGRCMVVVENATIGFAVLDKLVDLEYPSIYYSTKATHDYVDQYTAQLANNTVPGFTTSSKTRPLILAKMEEFIRHSVVKTYSRRLVNEMRTFVWNNGKPVAMRGYNDDLVMACAIGCWVKETALSENLQDLQYRRSFLGAIKKQTTTLADIPNLPISVDKTKHQQQKSAAETYQKYGWVLGIRKG
jgi:hypothetical protein